MYGRAEVAQEIFTLSFGFSNSKLASGFKPRLLGVIDKALYE